MSLFRLRRTLGFGATLLSVIFLLWGVWPNHQQTQDLLISGTWRIVIDLPSMVWVGDTGKIRLTLNENPAGDLQSESGTSHENARRAALIQVKSTVGQVHLAEARLEMGGVAVTPSDAIRQPFANNSPIDFFWRARPYKPGEYSGTLWLYLQPVTTEGGQAERQPVLARQITLKSRTLLGLNGLKVRLLGSLGTLAGLFLILFPKRNHPQAVEDTQL